MPVAGSAAGYRWNMETGGQTVVRVLFLVLMVVVIVAVDVLFFRNRLWDRLIVNVGIVLVFAAFYLRFVNRP